MANQPPSSRPWFRLGSQVRFERPPPPPTPSPQTPVSAVETAGPPRPMFGRLQSFLPLNPQVAEPTPPPQQQPPSQGRPGTSAQSPSVASSSPPVTVPNGPLSPTPPRPSPPASLTPPPANPDSPRVATPPSPRVATKASSPTPQPESPRTALPTPPRTPPRPQLGNLEPETKLPMAETMKGRPSPAPTPPPSPPSMETTKLQRKSSPPYSKTRQAEPLFKKPEEEKVTVTESLTTKSISQKKKKPSTSSEAPATAFGMLTLAGDNVGAHMELWGKSRRRRSGTKPPEPFTGRFHRLKEEDSEQDDGVMVGKGRKKKGEEKAEAARPMMALVNSNVQGANNSILFHSTCIHGSPGVHILLSSKKKKNRRCDRAPPPERVPYGRSKVEGGNNGDGYR